MFTHGGVDKLHYRHRLRRCLWALCLPALLMASMGSHAERASSEYSVKAAYLYNFAKFTRWPDATFPDALTPIRLCIIGASEMNDALDSFLIGKYVDERAVLAYNINAADTQLRSCQIIYRGPNASISSWQLLRTVQDFPVLTIGDGEDFLELGGVLSFVNVDQRIRFEINLSAAKRAGVNLSSRLMKIARNIRQP